MTLDTGSVRSCKDSGIDVDTNAAVSRSDKTRVYHLPLFPTRFLAVIDDVNQGALPQVPFGGEIGGEEDQGLRSAFYPPSNFHYLLWTLLQINVLCTFVKKKSSTGNDYEVEYAPKDSGGIGARARAAPEVRVEGEGGGRAGEETRVAGPGPHHQGTSQVGIPIRPMYWHTMLDRLIP